jgi:hypothetical protein
VQASERLGNSMVVQGHNDIAWAWLSAPTIRYPHRSFGTFGHAGSVHVLVRNEQGVLVEIQYVLANDRVYEDLLPRLIDLDGDGRDELILIESNFQSGSAIVVLGILTKEGGLPYLGELARSPSVGTSFRWLNPVGAADFDGDGRLDLAAVITPHIGGVLTLYRYKPPHLVAFASVTDVSNHRMGATEQRMAAIIRSKQHGPAIILPNMELTALYAFRWNGTQRRWQEIDKVKPMRATVKLMYPTDGGACAQLSDQSWWVIGLMD